MQFSTILSTSILLAGSAYAQSATPLAPVPTSSAPGAMMTVHVVQASDATGALTFAPNTIIAKPGDMVQWQFYEGNHSVVMSNFNNPCTPIQQSDAANAGPAFFSGYIPVNQAADNGRLTYTVQVKDTNPIWWYCAQSDHCQKGMVGVINPPTNSPQTLAAYQAAAKNAQSNIAPGGSATGGVVASGTTTGQTAAATKNSAPGGLLDAAQRGLVVMAFAGAAAFLML